jgi:anthrone oxygenase-like protein
MLFGLLALATAASFAGAAIYINAVEHPARLALDGRSQLAQWRPAYKRGFIMQSSLALISFIFGVLAWWQSGDWRWLPGAAVIVANWPYTIVVILPTNNRLMDDGIGAAEARQVLGKWVRLHAVRSVLGLVATIAYLWAAMQ